MSLTIGIDCTMRRTNVGLVCDGELIAELNADLGRDQAAKLPELVDRLLTLKTCTLQEVTQIAVTVGPGYYTGIRIGISYACALAEALNIPVVPIPTLYAFIRDLLPLSVPIAPVLRARKEFLYAAIYQETEEGFRELLPPSYMEQHAFAEEIKKYPSLLIVGEDASAYGAIPACFSVIPRNSAHGGQVALAVEDAQFAPVSPAEIYGNYLREPDIGAQ